jgi:hypothetical protein
MPMVIEHQCNEDSTSSATFIRFEITQVHTRHEKSDGNEKTNFYINPTSVTNYSTQLHYPAFQTTSKAFLR